MNFKTMLLVVTLAPVFGSHCGILERPCAFHLNSRGVHVIAHGESVPSLRLISSNYHSSGNRGHGAPC